MARRVAVPPSVSEILEHHLAAKAGRQLTSARVRELRRIARLARRVPGYLTVTEAIASAKRRAA